IVHGKDYLLIAELTRLQRVIIEAPRGSILDRNGEIFAENGLSYSITVDPQEGKKAEQSAVQLASIVGLPRDELAERVREIRRKSHSPVKLFKDADFRMFSIVEEHRSELPGIGSVIEQRRSYPNGRVGSHIIGYMGELTQEEFGKFGQERGYYYGQYMGRGGLERFHERSLKGKNGAKFQMKNYLNRVMEAKDPEDIKSDPPEPGHNLRLTIDLRLQKAVEEAFGDSVSGALVALDPRNGEVLALVSLPSFDPNVFTHIMTPAQYDSLFRNPAKPLFNRAIQATYPPGSTFKMLTALAGLESGYSENSHFSSCGGAYYFGGRPFKCWKAGGHGSLGLTDAIAQSCNVYFYQMGRAVGLENWQKVGLELGFGQQTGVDLIGEVPGRLPTTEYYKTTNRYYSPGMMLNLAIGQGENDVTIIQMAQYVGIIATEGIKARPHLILDEQITPERTVKIRPESFQVVKKGMLKVTTEGTARSLQIPGHLIAAKTGTAQNPHGAAHKLTVAFAPYDAPSIAVACVVENTEDRDPRAALMVVKRLMEEYFKHYPDKTTVAMAP
ncbi:MAG: penicillin-binding protein 2, partial [Candidatus Latescibacterota bacterium]